MGNPPDNGVYLPSPEEIEEKLAEIRSKWDEKTTKNRCVYKTDPLTIPEIVLPPPVLEDYLFESPI